MRTGSADLTGYRAALALVRALDALLVPAPFSPFEDVEETFAHVERLADTHAGDAAALFHLWLRWHAEGSIYAEPLEWVLDNLLWRHAEVGEAALTRVGRQTPPAQARQLRHTFGDDR